MDDSANRQIMTGNYVLDWKLSASLIDSNYFMVVKVSKGFIPNNYHLLLSIIINNCYQKQLLKLVIRRTNMQVLYTLRNEPE